MGPGTSRGEPGEPECVKASGIGDLGRPRGLRAAGGLLPDPEAAPSERVGLWGWLAAWAAARRDLSTSPVSREPRGAGESSQRGGGPGARRHRPAEHPIREVSGPRPTSRRRRLSAPRVGCRGPKAGPKASGVD